MNETTPRADTPGMDLGIDRDELRAEVSAKYAAVASAPGAAFHFHTGRVVADRCRYDMAAVDALPPMAVESFAGVANPFELRSLRGGERVVDLGTGAGFDCFMAGRAVGPTGHVIGVDMTSEMVMKSRAIAESIGADNVEFRDAFLEDLPGRVRTAARCANCPTRLSRPMGVSVRDGGGDPALSDAADIDRSLAGPLRPAIQATRPTSAALTTIVAAVNHRTIIAGG